MAAAGSTPNAQQWTGRDAQDAENTRSDLERSALNQEQVGILNRGREAQSPTLEDQHVVVQFRARGPSLVDTLLVRWGDYCEALFEDLARTSPRDLAHLVRGQGLGPAKLTYAAEILGKVKDSRLVRQTLVPLLWHVDPVVREGALYGLARHVDPNVIAHLRRMAQEDTSPEIREAAASIVEANES